MEKGNRYFIISIIFNIIFFAGLCYFIGTTFFDKNRINKLEDAIAEERAIKTELTNTNNKLRQDISGLQDTYGKLERTNSELTRIKQAFEGTNFQLGKGIEELRGIDRKLGEANKYNLERINSVENILEDIQNTGN